jgi:hypothetical protein
LRAHLPNAERVPADLALVVRETRGLSGGDILNVCVNSIHAASLLSKTTAFRTGRFDLIGV